MGKKGIQLTEDFEMSDIFHFKIIYLTKPGYFKKVEYTICLDGSFILLPL